jgi:DinB family protein
MSTAVKTELDISLVDYRTAVDEFLSTARAIPPDRWVTPRAPGAWTPAQIAEHIAITLEYSRALANGSPTGGSAPRFLRPLIRRFVVDSTLRAGRFTRKGRSPKVFQPSASPASQPEILLRIEGAGAGFESDLRRAGRAELDHPYFGRVPAVDYVKLQAIHTRHHRRQLPL